MKLTEKVFTRGGCYTALITLAMLLFARMMGWDTDGNHLVIINLRLYFTFAACGFAASLVELIFETKLDPIFKRLIHFFVLLVAFVTIFTTAKTGGTSIATKILVASFTFTVCYIVIFFALFGIKKLIVFIEKKYNAKCAAKPEQKPEKYTPRYK